jgi:hypothetical protein
MKVSKHEKTCENTWGVLDKFQIHIRRTQSTPPQSVVSHLRLSCRCPARHAYVMLVQCAFMMKKEVRTLKVTRCPMSAARIPLMLRFSHFTPGLKYTRNRRRNISGSRWAVSAGFAVLTSACSLCKRKNKCQADEQQFPPRQLLNEGVACLPHEDIKGIFFCDT